MSIARDRANRSGSDPLQIDNTKLVTDSGDLKVQDANGNEKKLIADEIHVGTGADKVILKRDSSTGKVAIQTQAAGEAAEGGTVASTNIYATTALLPTNPTDGQQALVTANNFMYIAKSNGWYKIAEITNTTPSVTSAGNATYQFLTDGTPVSIEITATDAEVGTALQYKYVVSSGSIGSTATVTSSATSGGTYSALAANTLTTNKFFKVTPSTNSAHAGTFSLTFSASDGIAVGTSSASEFTLQFDVSASYKFDGTGDHAIADGSNLVVGTNDFTIEYWVRANNFDSVGTVFDMRKDHNTSLMNNISTSGEIRLYANSGYRITADPISTNTWNHVALQRASGTTKMYLNGKEQSTTYSDTNNYTGDKIYFGSERDTTTEFDGYISNFRQVLGSTVYTATSPSNYYGSFTGGPVYKINSADIIGSGGTYTTAGQGLNLGTGAWTVEAWIYTSSTSWSLIDFGLSNGTHDQFVTDSGNSYFGHADGSAWNSLNWWSSSDNGKWNHIAYVSESSTVKKIYKNGVLRETFTSGSSSHYGYDENDIFIGRRSDGYYRDSGMKISNLRIVKGTAVYTGAFTPPTSPLTAISGTSLLAFQQHTGSPADRSGNSVPLSAVEAGTASTDTPFVPTFTVPTTDLTAITNTKLLALTESTPNFITNGSYHLTTTSSRVSATHAGFNWSNTDPFTYEMWYKFTGRSNGDCMFDFGPGNTFQMYVYNSQINIYGLGGGFVIQYGSAGYALNTWYHAAITGDGSGNIKAYIDGQQVGSTYASPGFNITGSLIRLNGYAAGGYTNIGITGFYSDVRFVNGTQVYTGNFTPPSGPLTTTGGTYPSNTNVNTSITASHTKFLTAQNSSGSLVDNSTFGHSLTVDSTVTPSAGIEGGSLDQSSSSYTVSLRGDATHSYATPFEQGTGGSVLFDGTGDYLSIPHSASFYDLGTADWTIECWVYFTDTSVFNGVFQLGKNVGALAAMLYTDGKLKLLEQDSAVVFESNTTFSANTWYHIAFTNDDSSNTQKLYVNGVVESNTGSKSTAFQFTEKTVFIGGRWFSSAFQRPMNGYISNFRIVAGTVLYTTNFTAPTSKLTAVTNTKLLTCNDSNTIDDASSSGYSITVNGDAIATRFHPF